MIQLVRLTGCDWIVWNKGLDCSVDSSSLSLTRSSQGRCSCPRCGYDLTIAVNVSHKRDVKYDWQGSSLFFFPPVLFPLISFSVQPLIQQFDRNVFFLCQRTDLTWSPFKYGTMWLIVAWVKVYHKRFLGGLVPVIAGRDAERRTLRRQRDISKAVHSSLTSTSRRYFWSVSAKFSRAHSRPPLVHDSPRPINPSPNKHPSLWSL